MSYQIRIRMGRTYWTFSSDDGPLPAEGDLVEDQQSKLLYRVTGRRIIKSPHGVAVVCSTKKEG
jgi:hypothetical protein